jgi:hypothetical protein
VEGCLSLRNHIAVRDTLRANPELRDEYAAVKKRVAASTANIDEYGQGKNPILQRILAQAGISDAERASINTTRSGPMTTSRDLNDGSPVLPATFATRHRRRASRT